MPFSKENTKKESYFIVFWKIDQDNKNIPYTDDELGDELVWLLSSSMTVIAVYLSLFTNLNKTAQATQKWQLDYFQKIELEE